MTVNRMQVEILLCCYYGCVDVVMAAKLAQSKFISCINLITFQLKIEGVVRSFETLLNVNYDTSIRFFKCEAVL